MEYKADRKEEDMGVMAFAYTSQRTTKGQVRTF